MVYLLIISVAYKSSWYIYLYQKLSLTTEPIWFFFTMLHWRLITILREGSPPFLDKITLKNLFYVFSITKIKIRGWNQIYTCGFIFKLLYNYADVKQIAVMILCGNEQIPSYNQCIESLNRNLNGQNNLAYFIFWINLNSRDKAHTNSWFSLCIIDSFPRLLK